jgi:LysM repeat protein
MKEVMIVVLVIVTLGIGAFNVAGQMVEKYIDTTAEHNLAAVNVQSITVNSGDTLWDYVNTIKNRNEFDGQELVHLIQDLNNLNPSEHLRIGQVLKVPVTVKERTQE